MHMIVCLDDHNGMLFNRRRQSKDKVQRSEMLKLCKERRLWMNAYSAKEFQRLPDSVCVDEAFMEKAGEYDYCFVENLDIGPYLHRISGLTVYRWNRCYPADLYFPLDVVTEGKKIIRSREFSGSSHERITEEEYG